MDGRQIIYVERVYPDRETAHITTAMTATVPEDGDDLSVDFATAADEDGVAYIERATANEERIEYTDIDEDNDILIGVTREDPKIHAAGSEISFGEDDDIELLADGHELGGRTIEAVLIEPHLWMFFALGKRPFGQEYEVEAEVVDGDYERIVTAPRGVVNTVPSSENPDQLGGIELGDGLVPDPPAAAPIVKQGVSVNIVDMSAYMAQVQIDTGGLITDLGPGSFHVEAQMSDDEGITWTDLVGNPGWTEILQGGTIQVHADLVGEVPASDPPIRRQYRYRYRVEDLEGLISDYSPTGTEQPGLSLTADWIEALVLQATKIYSPDVTGWRLEIGDPNNPILYWDGLTTRFSLDDAGNISVAGATITGGLFRTAATGTRMEIDAETDSGRIFFYHQASLLPGSLVVFQDSLLMSPPQPTDIAVGPYLELDRTSKRASLETETVELVATTELVWMAPEIRLSIFQARGFCGVQADAAAGNDTYGHGVTYGGVTTLTNVPSSITLSSTGTGDANVSAVSVSGISIRGFRYRATSSSGGAMAADRHYVTVGN